MICEQCGEAIDWPASIRPTRFICDQCKEHEQDQDATAEWENQMIREDYEGYEE